MLLHLLSLIALLFFAFGLFFNFLMAPAGNYLQPTSVCVSWQQLPLPYLINATLEDLILGLNSGRFTSVDLVRAYNARIQEVNPTLQPVTTLNPDALSIAAEADALRKTGAALGSLHGVPILLKDNIATKDRMPNSAGSYALLDAEVYQDSTVAAKLRKAGAILLGKTNLSQWANFRSIRSSNGWSAVGGQTLGAYYPGQDPSGSSSGSGVACSLGLAAACLGTETDGSIVMPAEANNLVGIKPTVGLVSRFMVVPVSEHQDTIGPMAGTVKDAAYILSAISGSDVHDNYTNSIPFANIPDYVAACSYSSLEGKRLGVPRNLFSNVDQFTPVIAAFNDSLDIFRKAGAEIVDDIYLEGSDLLGKLGLESTILKSDFPVNLASYFSQLKLNPHNITSLSDLEAFTQQFGPEAWDSGQGYDTSLWQAAIKTGLDNNSPQFWSTYTKSQYLAGHMGITGAMQNHTLDALILPTAFSTHLPAVLGSPIVTVPLGKYPKHTKVGLAPHQLHQSGSLIATAPNIPFGIAFLGERFSEEKLIGFAYAYEQRTLVRNRVQPYLKPDTELVNVIERNSFDLHAKHGASKSAACT